MAIFLDSADISDALWVNGLGFVAGITTNPKLLNGADPVERTTALLAAFEEGPICCQLTEIDSTSTAMAQAEALYNLDPGRIVVKIPTRTSTFEVASLLVRRNIRSAMTAIFSAEQALIAGEIGVEWVIPYVDRTSRLGGDGIKLVSEMREVLGAIGAPTRIMAGSIKSPAMAVAAVNAGAHAITAGRGILEILGNHELSERSISEFNEAGDVP